jgi:hypothetical protein
MTFPTLRPEVIAALRSAGATEEMIAAAVKAGGEFPTPQRGRVGRPRKYLTRAECDRAYYERRKQREKIHEKTSQHDKTHEKTPPEEIREDTLAITRVRADLRGRLEEAAGGMADPGADVYPIQALLDQGCDLDADVLPVVAREVPELPRPLKKWGAPWLVRDILAAREARLAGHPV